MAKVNVVKEIKEIGWSFISLTSKAFKGAVQEYNGVAVLFNMEEAMVIRDNKGCFKTKDYEKGVIKSKDFDVEDSGDLGAEIIAFYNDESDEVEFNEDLLAELGLADFSVQDSITARIKALYQLTATQDVPLN